jgi:hypothetical protein
MKGYKMENSIDPIRPQTARKNRRWLLWGILALVVLVGIAFAGGQLLYRQGSAAFADRSGGGGEMMAVAGGPGGEGGDRVFFKRPSLIPAPGLPEGEPDVAGLYLRREDQSIFIGTGEVRVQVEIPQGGGEPSANASASGPTMEVVVNRNTQLYKDITEFDFTAGENSEPVQQVVESIDSLDNLLEEVNTTDTLSVWGERSGDRVIASVIVYRPLDMPPR